MDKQTECGCWNCKYKGKKSDACKTCITQLISAEENKYTVPSGWVAQTPRICEIIGVDVGKPFCFGSYFDAYVDNDGTIKTNTGTLMDSDDVCQLINHPERLSKTRYLTEFDLQIICTRLGAKWLSRDIGGEDNENYICFWADEPYRESNCGCFDGNGLLGSLVPSLVPNLNPGKKIPVKNLKSLYSGCRNGGGA